MQASYTRPLPEPVNLNKIHVDDYVAIFSKMNPKAFARSMRLDKSTNQYLSRNLTNFSIRIMGNNLRFVKLRFDTDDFEVWLDREASSGTVAGSRITDPNSVLPFSFSRTTNWDMKIFRAQFDQMKWPFRNLGLEWRSYGSKTSIAANVGEVKPWMFGATIYVWTSFEDFDKAILLKIKKISIYFFSDEPGRLKDLLDTFETVTVSGSSALHIAQIVQKWQLGNWNHKTTVLLTKICLPQADAIREILGSLTTSYHFYSFGTTVFLVPNPDKVYFAVVVTPSTTVFRAVSCCVSLFSNIRTLNDLIYLEKKEGLQVLDYSGYKGNPDSPLDPKTFCDQVRAYDREFNW